MVVGNNLVPGDATTRPKYTIPDGELPVEIRVAIETPNARSAHDVSSQFELRWRCVRLPEVLVLSKRYASDQQVD